MRCGIAVALLLAAVLVQRSTSQRCSSSGSLRLVGGSTQYEGRVEVCRSSQWGTICDDLWDNVDASVVCKQLGYSSNGSRAFSSARFGRGSGPIHMDDVRCTGRERRLVDCPHITQHNCRHLEDASVRCVAPIHVCSDGAVRLVGAPRSNSGRVEVCRNNAWGTVCDDGWRTEDAAVVCRQLGFSSLNAVARGSAFYGAGSGPIHMDDVACRGTESRLIDCRHTSQHNCGHSEDASVTCNPIPCSNGAVRLTESSSSLSGRVEVCLNRVWGTVCDDFWDTRDAGVVCSQLGFSRLGASSISRFFPTTIPIHLDDVRCRGTETRLVDCPYDSRTSDCSHLEDVYVTCRPAVPSCIEGAVRLVNGSSTAGRVEVCYQGSWGTVCDDRWGANDAGVVCKQLGFSRYNAIALSNARYGQGILPIKLDEVGCRGTENALLNCTFVGRHDCSHSEDASVVCNRTLRCSDGDLRLRGGRNGAVNEGRVEVCLNEDWGTVCDSFWDSRDAQVVCRQLGYSSLGALAYSNAFFGQGRGSILVDGFFCSGSERRLLNCTHRGQSSVSIFCGHDDDAGVRCNVRAPACLEGSLRLVNGNNSNSTSGRVEICYRGSWGTVCDDSWDNTDARVVCRQLGFSRFNAIAHGNARFGRGTGSIHLDDVGCTGTESRLLDCRFNSIDNCGHHEDAGAVCNATFVCGNGDVRLRGSNRALSHEGRVEVCWNETWGTVCDTFWSANDARVVCRQLGFSVRDARAFTNAFFGQGSFSTPILLQALQCRGTESRLVDCPHSGVGVVSFLCGHDDDSGVRCTNVQPCGEAGEIRLVGGVSPYEGRVEVCGGDGEWGTVCDDGWTSNNARVVCRQLNLTATGISPQWFSNARYGAGSGAILLDDVSCRGSETTLSNCSHTSRHNCIHSEDVGVRCSQCIDNSIRLRGGPTQFEGRVEVCLGGTWGTVCDDGWSPFDAVVTCRQLGFNTQGARALSAARYGQGTGIIAMDNVRCNSRETFLTSCPYLNSTAIRSCTHREDASVICRPPAPDRVQRLTASRVTTTTVTLRWVSSSQEHVDITGFDVRCSSSFPISSFGNVTIQGNSTFLAVVRGLEENTRHSCCVYAITNRGNSAQTCVSVTTRIAAPSAAPRNLLLRTFSSNIIVISWSPPPLISRNGVISRYRIEVTDTLTSSVRSFSTTSTQFRVSSLLPYRLYEVSVAAENSAGRGPSQTDRIRMPEAAPSGPPLQLRATILSSTAFELTWSPPQPELQNGRIQQYTLRIIAGDTGLSSRHIVSGNTSRYVVTNLRPFLLYSCYLSAMTVREGPFANVNISLPEDRPSASPARFVANYDELRPTSVLLNWNAVPASQRNGIITGYVLTVTAVTGNDYTSNTTVLRSTLFLHEVTGLMLNTMYNISLAAQTSVGVGPSVHVLVSTIQIEPSNPPGLGTVTRRSANEIEISWDSVVNDEEPVLGYVIKYRPIVSVQKRNTEDLAILIETNQTNYVVSSLDPRVSYAISVAARNRAGIGTFSEEIIVELYSNSAFKLRISGAIVCLPWLLNNGQETQRTILNSIATEISKRCSCPFTTEYIANTELMCGDSTTDRVIVEGALVALPQTSEISLHKHLQDWVDEGPSVVIIGVPVTVIKCSTFPSDKDDCPLQRFVSTTQSVASFKLQGSRQSGSSVYLYGGVGGAGVVVLALVTCLVVALVWGVRRKKRQPFFTHTVSLDAHNPHCTTPNFAESKLDDVKFDFSDSGSHIYECPDTLFGSKATGEFKEDNCDYSDLKLPDYGSKAAPSSTGPVPYQIPQSSVPVRNAPHLDKWNGTAQGYDVPKSADDSKNKKSFEYMGLLTKTKPLGNVYEGVHKSDAGPVEPGHGRPAGASPFAHVPGGINSYDPEDEDQYIAMGSQSSV